MANTKEYKIVINGLTESISSVESLNKQLDQLEQRMKSLSSSRVSTGGGSSTSNSALSEEEKIQKQIEQIEEKRIAHSKEIYQNYLSAKDALKEVEKNQKAIVAGDRVQTKTYANTIAGMKQELADIKATMQTVDLGDTEQLDKMTKRANELNDALKKIEYSYGQFGRNVGNYASAAEGFKGLAIQVGDMVQNFDNAKQAMKELKKERDTLAAKKDMGLISAEEEKRLKDLIPAVAQLQSSIADAGKPMDALLDSMQSFVAITQSVKGLSTFFGIDSSEAEKAIKNLVALQNAMQGLQTIQKQLNSQEGIGKMFAPLSANVDKATSKLLAFNTALLGTGKAAKAAAVGIKAFGTALKAIGIGLAIAAISYAIEKVTDLIESFKKASEAEKQVQEAASKAYAEASAQLLQYQARVDNFNGSLKDEKKLVESLNKDLGSAFGTYKSLAQWKKVLKERTDAYIQSLVLEAQIQAKINQLVEAYERLDQVKQTRGDFRIFGSYSKDFNEANNKIKELEKDINNLVVSRDKLNKDNKLFDYSDQVKKGGTKTKDAILEIEKEIAQARINSMKEGLNKTITQLEEERKQRLAKLKTNGTMYKKYEKEINAIYDARILEERKKWADQMEKVNRDLWTKIYNDTLESTRKTTALIEQETEMMRKKLEGVRSDDYLNQSISSYGIQGKRQLSPKTSFILGIGSNNMSPIMEDTKKLMDLSRQAQAAQNRLMAMQLEYKRTMNTISDDEKQEWEVRIQTMQMELDKGLKALNEWKKKMGKVYDPVQVKGIFKELSDESYSSSLSTQFEQAFGLTEKYWQQRIAIETRQAEKLYQQLSKQRKEEYNAEERELRQHEEDLIKEADDYKKNLIDGYKALLDKRKITKEEYDKKVEEAEKKRDEAVERIAANFETEWQQREKKFNNDLIQLETQRNDKIRDVNKEAYQSRLQDLRDFQTAISNLESKQPVVNAWGITNFKETNKNNRNLLSAYEAAAKEIVNQRVRAAKDYKGGLIDEETYRSTLRELDNFAADLGEKMDKVRNELSVTNQIGQFIQDIQQYVQALGSAIQDVFSSIWDYQDYLMDKEQDELDDWNDKLDKALDKQQDIIEEHKDSIDSIEDELANSRGDRRQHLIDQLNAEITAERAAQREKQRIQKEQEAAEKKQEALDKKRKEEEYDRNVKQAFISWHLSVANALATQPFMPVGIAMGALATALGAVQYALVKSQKPYAKGGQLDGGVAQGPRHSGGGIPVLGGRASIEGGEFITNRQTTAQNVDLLEFVNSKHRKLSIDDFIDFYSTTPRKVIRGVRTKFEDGGYLPTLPSTLDVKDQLQNIVINQDNRPVVVSVVDINNKQEDVRRVQTLAGL